MGVEKGRFTGEVTQSCWGKGKADAGLAASIFHFGEIEIPDLKNYLKQQKIEIR